MVKALTDQKAQNTGHSSMQAASRPVISSMRKYPKPNGPPSAQKQVLFFHRFWFALFSLLGFLSFCLGFNLFSHGDGFRFFHFFGFF